MAKNKGRSHGTTAGSPRKASEFSAAEIKAANTRLEAERGSSVLISRRQRLANAAGSTVGGGGGAAGTGTTAGTATGASAVGGTSPAIGGGTSGGTPAGR